MNILKHIGIKGEIFCEYAFLSFDFEFENELSDRISTEYIFRLPKGALVSDVKILAEDRLIRAKITTASHASKIIDLNVPAAQLRKIDNSTYSMNLSGIAKGSCHILISAYTELNDNSGKKRLNIPLCADCFADIKMNMHQSARCTSTTHNIEVDEKIETRILADRDFCLEFSEFERQNSAIAASDMFGGQMLIRIYPKAILKRKFKKVLFIYHPDLFGAVSRCAKEFILYAKEQFSEFTLVSSGGVLSGNDTDSLIEALSKITYGGEIKLDGIQIDSETLPILVSEKPVLNTHFFNVTIGDAEGENHIFARDNIQTRAVEIINALSVLKAEDIDVSAENADTEVVSVTDNSVTIYASYSGTMPKSVKVNGETIYLNNVSVYRSFAPIGLVCANLHIKREERRLLSAEPFEIIDIRKRLEKIGVKFSALNSETALMATLSGSKVSPIRVAMPIKHKKTYSAFDERYSMFEEVEKVKGRDKANAALDIILRSMRADGAICADGEINEEYKKKQTLICLLALIRAEFKDKTYIKYARDFIGKYSFDGIQFTEDKELAKKFLDKFFAGKTVPTKDYVPDLITSANIIRLFW